MPKINYDGLSTEQAHYKTVSLINDYIFKYSKTDWLRQYVEMDIKEWVETINGNKSNSRTIGVEKYSNGYYYGQFSNNKRDGSGCYIWNDGRIYIGGWLNGDKEDMGINANGKGYVEFCTYNKDKRVTQSWIRYSNGRTEDKWIK